METLDEPGSMKLSQADALAGMPEEVKSESLGPMVGIAAIALNLAMKYHDISTIQDGALYQQYKLEGRNMVPLHMDMVFETAMQIERHLISANKRISQLMVLACLEDNPAETNAGERDIESQPKD